MQVYYLSADKKERIDFDGRTYGIADMDIFGHKWSYEERNEKIEKFKRGLLEKEIEINISDDANASWQNHYAYIQDVFDKDIINNKRGKLYVNGYYLECNVYAEETEDQFRNWCDFQTCVFKIISDRPVWVKETKVSFLPYKEQQEEKEETTTEAEDNKEEEIPLAKGIALKEFNFDLKKKEEKKKKKTLFDYPFDYKGVYGRKTLENTAFFECDFIMTFYGFTENPSINIGGHPYKVNVTLYEGERLVIDSRAGTVKKIGRLGEIEDEYNAREKEYSVFKKVPAGINTVSWSGGFGVDITLIEERSQPKWNL